jgi:hypothetical protein
MKTRIFFEFEGTIEDTNGIREFYLRILEPQVDANTPHRDFLCRFHCPALLEHDFDVYGVDERQARELALNYARIRTEGAIIRDRHEQIVKF